MSLWVNHVAIAYERDGDTTTTSDPSNASAGSGGTVVTGSVFTPTAGRLLQIVTCGGVTSTTPSGWTLREASIQNQGVYLWTVTAAGGDTITTTHNGSNYPVILHWFEFAAGTTWLNDVSGTGVGSNGTMAALDSLTGTWLGMSLVNSTCNGGEVEPITNAWTAPTLEILDTYVAWDPTDGYFLSIGYREDGTGTGYQPTHTVTNPPDINAHQGITWALTVVAGPGDPTAVSVTPATVSIPVAATQQLTAMVSWENISPTDESATTTWVSDDTGIATVSSTGLVTAVAEGTATITGTYDVFSDTSDITVTGAVVLQAVTRSPLVLR